MRRTLLTIVAGLFLTWVLTTETSTRGSAETIRKADLRSRFVPGRLLVKFREHVGPDHARQIIASHGARYFAEIPEIGVHILDLPYQASEKAIANVFAAQAEVEFVELDRLRSPAQIIPNDPLYDNPNSWSLPRISAPEAWSLNTGTASVTIAVLDSGVDATHPDLASQIVPGWNMFNNNADTSDVWGHGTAVAGVAAAASNNAIGVSSVAWGCRIMPIRISDTSGMAPESVIASGLTWAANHGARVANVSYYVTGSKTISSAAKYFQSKGGLVTVAAGNNGALENGGDDPNLITVGATDAADVLYSWSNRGNNIDVVAPGSVYTTARGGGYGVGGGTSFASPVVAGVAALIMSANPSLTPRQVETILKQSADDLGDSGWDSTYGYGRINAARAVVAANDSGSSDTLPPTVAITSPGSGSVVSGIVIVLLSVTDDVGVIKSELYVDGTLVTTSTAAPFSLKWNSRKARAGQHSLHSKAYDQAGNVGTSTAVAVFK